MDSVKSDNERELTSTMGNVLSMSSKDEKNDTSDATPTSSTDANTTPTSSRIVSDDPISSTSSDIIEQNKSKASEANMQNSLEPAETAVDEPDKSSSLDPEADLLEMSISNVSNEKITEDVEDLVHDLESLLGESTDSFNIPIKRKDDRKSPSESEGRKLMDKKDAKSTDWSDATKVPDEKGDANSMEQIGINNQPQTSLEGTQEIICSGETVSKEADNDAGTKTDEIPDENILSTAAEVPEVSEIKDVQINKADLNEEINREHKETNNESDESNKFINAPCSVLEKDQEKLFKPESSEPPQISLERTFVSEAVEEKSDILHNENDKSGEQTVENVKDSAVKEVIDCVVPPEEQANVVKENKEKLNKEDEEEFVEQPETGIIEAIEKFQEDEDKPIDSKIENLEYLKENEVTLVIEDICTDDNKAQENELQTIVGVIASGSEREDMLEDVTIETAATIQSCDNELDPSKDLLKNNEESKEEIKDAVEEPPREESAAVVEIDTEDIETEKDADASMIQDTSELPSFISETEEQPGTQYELVVDPVMSDVEQCKVGCGQVDGTVTENEENKLQTETALNTEPAECETISDSKAEKIPSQVQDISESIPEDVVNEINEVEESIEVEEAHYDAANVTELESQVNIPESTSEIVTEDLAKIEIIATPAVPLESTEAAVENIQCSASPTTDKTISIQPIDETPMSEPTEIASNELSSEIEVSKSPIAENTIPKVTTDVEASVSNEGKEILGISSELNQVEDDKEPVQTIMETVQLLSESTMDTSEQIVQVENPKSTSSVLSESKEEKLIEKPEETKTESLELLGKPAEDSIQINQSESKEISQLVAQAEESKDIAIVTQFDITEIKTVGGTEGKPLEESNSHEVQKESIMETEEVEATTCTLAEEIAPCKSESDSVDIQTESILRVTPGSSSADPEKKSLIVIDELPEISDETPFPIKKPCSASTDVSDTADELSKVTEKTAELNEETAKPAVETSKPVEEISTPVEEILEPDDLPKLENESQEIVIEKSLEVGCSVETMPDQVTKDVSKSKDESGQDQIFEGKLEGDEKIGALEVLAEDSDREKSENEEMTVEPDQEQTEIANSDKVIDISDEDSKKADEDPDTIQILSSSADSDSEEVVPVLALEPDEPIPSPKEAGVVTDDSEVENSSVEVHPSDTAAVTEPFSEIDDILISQGRVDETVAIDMQENLETILAVATLQNIENMDVATCEEPEMTEKERREMEALRKAVESITENTTNDYEDEVNDVVEIIENVAVPEAGAAIELETVGTSGGLLQVVASELVEDKVGTVVETNQTESMLKVVDSVALDNSSKDMVELEIEEPVENVQVVREDLAEEIGAESKMGNEAEVDIQALPDTSEDKIVDSVTRRPEIKDVLPDSSQSTTLNEEARQSETNKETRTRSNERSRRHKKSCSDNKLEELSINVDVPDREKPYSPKITIKPIRVPDEEVSTTSNSDTEVGKGSLKMTITKQSDKMHSILKIYDPESSEAGQEAEEPIPKLIIKPKMQQVEQQHSPKMSTRSSRQVYSPTSSSQRSGSPRITIKPVVKPDKVEPISPLKIKIKPEHIPKVNIKPVPKPDEDGPRESVPSPRKVIIKPIVKPVEEPEQVHSPRITIKPIPKPEAEKDCTLVTPRLNIKPVKKPDDDDNEVDRERSSPKITIKPIIKPLEPDTQTVEGDEEVKERIVLKINKGNLPTPTKESKKREHPPDEDKSEKLAKITVKFSKGGGHPHIVQQPEESNKRSQEEQSSPEKVKKQKTEAESPISTRSKHKEIEAPIETRSKHKEAPGENPTGDYEKTKQKETEPAHESPRTKHKDPMPESPVETKRAKLKDAVPETPTHESTRSSRHKEAVSDVQVSETTKSKGNVSDSNNESFDDVKIIETKLDSPIVISEDSRSQDSGSCVIIDELKDPLSAIPVFEITAESAKAMLAAKTESVSSTPCTPPTPTPRKRGRPRKVPIVVREDFKEQDELPKPEGPKEDGPPAAPESGRPKRSCRGQSARATLGIKPRKPRGGGRGRGSRRGMGTRSVPMKPEGEVKLSKAKLKLMQRSVKEELAKTAQLLGKEKKALSELEGILASNVEIKPPPDVALSEVPESPFTIFPVPSPQGAPGSLATLPGASPKSINSLLAAESLEPSTGVTIVATTSVTESSELVMVDEETRMSADTNSRAQTPAKQVIPSDAVIEESQSSVQSSATTESGKARPSKAPRLEVQEPEGAVISADQLTEYYWNGNGPFMLQEQVAQFLGIKSFKRKYPGIMRRMLEMQERDFIRESGLATEHMCDLGLTAVNSADILDIMYSDFQEKYEEYCKHQRDRQAKDLINKQKALSLAASQEKNKADITKQAVQSAAQWNSTFNKTRKEQRKACMDLQTLTVHYPKGKMKQINKAKVGNFPVALVPGQFTDYYQELTPTEINNLPINTMCYDPINIIPAEESDDSDSDGSDSDSDSSSSSSGSGSDSSSGVEDCKLCKHSPKKSAAAK